MSLKRFMRYFGLALAILFILWLVLVTAIYFLVNEENVKKLAISLVNENTEGELDIGGVRLRVFPLLHLEISDLNMKSSENFNRAKLFSADTSRLSFNVFTLLVGKPSITLSLRNPHLNIISDAKTTNIEDLFGDEKKDKDSSPPPGFINYLFMSKIIFDIRYADIDYSTKGELASIKGMDFLLEIEPVTRNLTLKLKAPVEYLKDDISVSGDLDLSVLAHMRSQSDIEIQALLDATRLRLLAPGVSKTRGDSLKLELTAKTNASDTLELTSFELELIESLISGTGVISDFKGLSPKLDLDLKMGPYDVRNLGRLSEDFKKLNASGKLSSVISVSGFVPSASDNSKNLNLKLDMDASSVSFDSSIFKKEKDVPMAFNLDSSLSYDALRLRSFVAELSSLKLLLSGRISGLDRDDNSYDLNLELEEFPVSDLSSMLPELSEFSLSGLFSMKLSSRGALTPLPLLNSSALFSDRKNGNNLRVKLSNSNADRSTIALELSSSKLILDPYMPTSTAHESSRRASSETRARDDRKKKNIELIKKEDVDLIKSVLDDYSLRLSLEVDELKQGDLKLNDLLVKGLFTKDELSFSRLELKLLQAKVIASFKTMLNKEAPHYTGKLDIKGLDVKDAASIFMPGVSGVIDGVISTDVKIDASGYSVDDLKKTIKGAGSFSFDNFVYSAEELNNLINDALKDSPISGERNILGSNPGWETVQGDYTIKDEKINIERFYAREGSYEAKGKGWLDFNEYMDMYIDLMMPFRRIPYEALRVPDSEIAALSIRLNGPVLRPRFDTAHLLDYLARKTIEYGARRLKDRARQESDRLNKEARARAEEEKLRLRKKAEEEAKKAKERLGDDLKEAIRGFRF